MDSRTNQSYEGTIEDLLQHRVPVKEFVEIRPVAGTRYIYKAPPGKFNDWRSDGIRMKQNGGYRPKDAAGVKYRKLYFKVKIKPGSEEDAYSTEFTKMVMIHPHRPGEVYVEYAGDESVVTEFSHGNAKNPAKTSKPFYRTRPSVIAAAKEGKDRTPSKVHQELLAESSEGPMIRQIVDAPRDRKQITNAQERARESERLSNCGLFNLTHIEEETGFISNLVQLPDLIVICRNKSK